MSQENVAPMSCFVVAPVASLAEVVGPEADIAFARRVMERLEARGQYDPRVGGYFRDALPAIRDVWNECHPGRPVEYRSIDVGSHEWWQDLHAGKSWSVGINASATFQWDKRDGVLERFDRPFRYGHAVRAHLDSGTGKVYFLDNYGFGPGKYFTFDLDKALLTGVIERRAWGFFFVSRREQDAPLARR